MVKVISVHHFLSQDVLTVSRPLASTLAGSNTLLTAIDNLNVEVRDLKKAAELTHSFHTIDHVSEIVHSPIGNYVATLEGNPGDKGAAIRLVHKGRGHLQLHCTIFSFYPIAKILNE